MFSLKCMYLRFSCHIHSRLPGIAMNYTEQIRKCCLFNWYLLVAVWVLLKNHQTGGVNQLHIQ